MQLGGMGEDKMSGDLLVGRAQRDADLLDTRNWRQWRSPPSTKRSNQRRPSFIPWGEGRVAKSCFGTEFYGCCVLRGSSEPVLHIFWSFGRGPPEYLAKIALQGRNKICSGVQLDFNCDHFISTQPKTTSQDSHSKRQYYRSATNCNK